MRDAWTTYAIGWRRKAIGNWNWMIPVMVLEMTFFVCSAIASREVPWLFWLSSACAVVIGGAALFAVYWRGELVEAVARIERGEDIWL